jgi:hypothetical protein
VQSISAITKRGRTGARNAVEAPFVFIIEGDTGVKIVVSVSTDDTKMSARNAVVVRVSVSTTNGKERVDNVAVPARSVNMADKSTNAKIVAGTVYASMEDSGIIVKSAGAKGYARMGNERNRVESVEMDGVSAYMTKSSTAVKNVR